MFPAFKQTDREIRLSHKILYGIGEIPITVAMVLVGLFLLFFYNSVMKLPGTLVGIAGTTGLLLDAVIDPYIGYRSDHSRSRWGRRHGYMLVGGPAMGICLWLLLNPPQHWGTVPLFLWLLGATLLFRFAGALYRIPYLSMGAELSSNYQERTTIVSIRSFFGLCGTMTAAGLSFAFFLPGRFSSVDHTLNYADFEKLGLAFGALMVLTSLVATLGTPVPVFQNSADLPASRRMSFWVSVREALRNASFRHLWLSFTLFFLAVVLNAAVAIHYFTWYAGIDDNRILGIVQVGFYLGALAGVLLWLGISRYAEKKALCLWAFVGTALLMFAASFLIGEGRLFGTGNARPLILGHVIGGMVASAFWVLPPSMLADVADEDELYTGCRREGVFFGMLNFGEKVAAGVSFLVGGILLDYFVGLGPGTTPDVTASQRIGLVYGLLPGVLLLGAALLLSRYALNRQAVIRIQSELRERRRSPRTESSDLTETVLNQKPM